MKINLYHPNGDIHEYDTDNPATAQELASDIEFELTNGCAEWVGICRASLSDDEQEEIAKRVCNLLTVKVALSGGEENDAELAEADFYTIQREQSTNR